MTVTMYKNTTLAQTMGRMVKTMLLLYWWKIVQESITKIQLLWYMICPVWQDCNQDRTHITSQIHSHHMLNKYTDTSKIIQIRHLLKLQAGFIKSTQQKKQSHLNSYIPEDIKFKSNGQKNHNWQYSSNEATVFVFISLIRPWMSFFFLCTFMWKVGVVVSDKTSIPRKRVFFPTTECSTFFCIFSMSFSFFLF